LRERKSSRAKRRKARAKTIKPIRFVAVEHVFEPLIKVRALRDVSGWASRDKRIKYALGNGRIGFVDEQTAREWQVKGHIEIVSGDVKPVSPDEAAEILSTLTTIGPGVANG